MRHLLVLAALGSAALLNATPASAEWSFSSGPVPNAFIQTNNATLELQCDRIRFAPAGYEDSQDILSKRGLSLRFMSDGQTEAAAFQLGDANAMIELVDNYPVEIRLNDMSDYNFILDQVAQNAALNMSMIDQDVTYGIFDLKGSGRAVKSLRASCGGSAQSAAASTPEAPEGLVYCGGGAVQRVIEYGLLSQPDGQWDAIVTVNGDTLRAMTAYSYFGNAQPPAGFVVALLGEDRSEFLVFEQNGRNWLEFGDYTYEQCN